MKAFALLHNLPNVYLPYHTSATPLQGSGRQQQKLAHTNFFHSSLGASSHEVSTKPHQTLLLLIPLILLLDYNCQQLNLPRINCLHISNDTHRRDERSHKFERYVSTRQSHFC